MPRKKRQRPTVYLDSNVLSVLCYRGIHISAAYFHMVTKQWWETEREWFSLHGSAFTETELRQGEYPGQEEAVQLIRRWRYLPFSAEVRRGADLLLVEKIVPETKPGDATQLAFATVHRMDLPVDVELRPPREPADAGAVG